MQEAILERPDIIVLPEMWNTGYALEQLEEIADEDGKKAKPLYQLLLRNIMSLL